MPLKAIATTNALPIALMYTCAPQEYCSEVWLQPWAGGKEKAQPKGHYATDALLDVSLKPLRNRWVCPLKSLLSAVLVPLAAAMLRRSCPRFFSLAMNVHAMQTSPHACHHIGT